MSTDTKNLIIKPFRQKNAKNKENCPYEELQKSK